MSRDTKPIWLEFNGEPGPSKSARRVMLDVRLADFISVAFEQPDLHEMPANKAMLVKPETTEVTVVHLLSGGTILLADKYEDVVRRIMEATSAPTPALA